MTTKAAEALEVALWLHRVPSRRVALLGRPLPDGIGELLRVATGGPDRLAAAASLTGESEATVLEAVRFYLQQILFHDDADAYRVLGLRPDASHAEAREHHHLLQHWLHPDRSGQDGWESVYAVRINRAWSQLRTPPARAAYDAALRSSAKHVRGQGHSGSEYRIAGTGLHARGPQVSGNRSRNLTIVVLLGCVGLLGMIALRQEAPPQWRDSPPALAGIVEPAAGDPALPLPTMGGTLGGSFGAVESEPTPLGPVPVRPPVSVPVLMPAETPPVAPVRAPATTSRAVEPDVPARVGESAPAPQVAVEAPPLKQTATIVPAPVSMSATQPAAVIVQAEPSQARPVVQDAFQRMTQAQERALAVVRYLADRSAGPPPVWNDVATMRRAERIRTALHGRHGSAKLGLELQAPLWRLSADGAYLESRYLAGNEQGRLELALTWREQQLLVSGISLEPDA